MFSGFNLHWITLNYIFKGLIKDTAILVQETTWRLFGTKPLPGTILTQSYHKICISWLQSDQRIIHKNLLKTIIILNILSWDAMVTFFLRGLHFYKFSRTGDTYISKWSMPSVVSMEIWCCIYDTQINKLIVLHLWEVFLALSPCLMC